MSYKDHLEAQKKYIQTKKEARQAKEDKERNPRPPRLDPPPNSTNPWLLVAFLSLIFLPIFSLFFFVLPNAIPTDAQSSGLIVWIQGTEEEFLQIKNWLEPEILANNLEWKFEHGLSRQDLVQSISLGTSPDLLILDADFAQELYLNEALATFWDKQEGMNWDNTFAPLWEIRPFQKNLGWAILRAGQVEEARHLFTLMRQFGEPFNP